VSCDSVQVYRSLDIGSAKPGPAERQRVRHHLVDVADPDEAFTAAQFVRRADEAAREIAQRGRAVIVCGGTGLYLRAWLRGLFPAPQADPAIRARHREEGAAALSARLREVDPEAAAAILPGDQRRLSRALEVYEQTGVPISELRRRARGGLRYRTLLVGLTPPREELYARIDERFDAMMAAGLLEEVRRLLARHGEAARALGALGYRQLVRHLVGASSLDEAVAQAKRETRRYAKRQLTWFRSEPAVHWHERPEAVDLEVLRRFLEGTEAQP
jgi:tRNA dimethylallyltransferase